jgi:hypothetical protein
LFADTTGQKPDINTANGTSITDNPTGASSSNYPGELLLFTNPNYVANGPSLSGVSALSGITFQFGGAGFTGGNDVSKNIFSLTGLNPTATLPSELQNYAPFLLWQDRANSTIAYTVGNGIPDSATNCPPGTTPQTGNGGGLGCMQTPPFPTAPEMSLQATPSTTLAGAVYQPRGAWITMQGGGSISGALQIVTGALNDGGSGTVILTGVSNPITVLATALIE